MTRQEASEFTRTKLIEHGLSDWSIRFNADVNSRFLGMCLPRDKTIVLSTHHIDIHPTLSVENTILHEIAHALTPGHAHDEVWSAKAREIGCDNTLPCSNLSLAPDIIDAIRSGATVEVTFDEHVIRTPKYSITRIQDKCPYCGKVAKTDRESLVQTAEGPDLKFIYLECGHTLVKKIPKGTPFHTFQFGGDTDCTHEWDKNKCLKCGRYRPYQFQIEGMQFLEAALAVNNGGAILDEMGLGKTIQAGGLVYFHPEYQPTLWVVKSGLKYQFAVFLINWLGDKHIPQVIETSKDYLIPGLKHYIIGYDMLVPKTRTNKKNGKEIKSGFDITKFDTIGIKLVVLDEVQQIKNVDSSRTQMVRRVVRGRKVIALSGTPWNNRGSELFPLLNMLDPIKFNSEDGFKRNWVDKIYVGRYEKEGGIKRIPQFKEYTKDLLLRRERTEVLPELPLVNRTKMYVKMTEEQEAVYDEAVAEFVDWFHEQHGAISGMALIAAMAKMRHLVALAKIPSTMDYVRDFIEETDRKLVVFAHHQDAQQILFDEIKAEAPDDILVLKLTSEMSGAERYEVQEKFNNAKRAILVASQLAAGEGLNLQTAADCIMHERQWNPGKEEQAEGRFIRIGQLSQSVNAVYTHMQDGTTIDSALDLIVERKRLQFHAVHNKGEAPKWSEESLVKEVADSIVNAHNAKKNRKLVANG